jgi:hypothetical protein
MDRLKKLLDAHPVSHQRDKKDTQGLSREAERTQLNTADARFNKQVYQNEVRQANAYEQSAMPPTPADVGVSFKIGSFVNKLSQLLGFKADLNTQLQALISIGSASPARLIQDARLISISTDFFKIVDILATYNELVNYIQLYAPQIRSSSDFANGINSTYLLPLIQLLKSTGNLYTTTFNNFPTGNPRSEADRKAYERFRDGSSQAYSTVSLMGENLNNAIYSGLTKKDIKRYETGKRIKSTIFGKNPLPVAPAIDPVLQAQQEADALAQQQQQQQQQQQGQPQPAPAQPVAPPPPPPVADPQVAFASAEDLVRAYVADRTQAGIPLVDGPAGQGVLNTRRLNNVNGLIADIRQLNSNPAQFSKGAFERALKTVRAEVVAQLQAQQGQQGGPAPAPQQQQQQQQAPARQLTAEQQAYAQNGTRGQQVPLNPVPSLQANQQETVWNAYTTIEDADGAVLPPSEAGALRLFNALPQDFQNEMRRPQPDGSFDLTAEDVARDDLIPWIENIQRIRVAWARANNIQANELWGLGNEEFLRGSGIMDTLSDWAGRAGDAVSGWYKTVADNMPTMSDVRRATSSIVPDRFQDYIPSGLQRTFTDKAKDFFGFGRGVFEDRKRLAELARGDPRTVDMSQGREAREKMMPFINEFNAPAEFLKRRGEVLAGGVYNGLDDGINDLLPYEMYGGNVDYDDAEEMTPFKRRIGMPNPFSGKSRMETLPIRPAIASNATDLDETLIPFQQMFGATRSGFEKEKEKPKDMDENPDPIRITNENYKIFTGKQKAPKYKISA